MAEFGIGSLPKTVSPNLESLSPTRPAKISEAPHSGASFVDTLKSALENTNDALKAADKAAQNFATGDAQNLHDVMIAMEKADVSLRTITAMRGKIVEAYQEIMRMPV